MNSITKTFITASLIILSKASYPQSSTYNPYSYFGLGEIDLADHGISSGMGGTGIGIKSGYYINWMNPASYSGIDSLSVIFDVSFNVNTSRFKSLSQSYQVIDGNISKIAFGFRVFPRWATSFGVVPYSKVGYKIDFQKQVEGTTGEYFDISCSGNGGLSKVFWGNSYKLGKHISLGLNSSVLIGSITKSENYYVPLVDKEWQVNRMYKPKSTICFDLGFQYTDSIGKDWQYTFGAIGGNEKKISIKETYSTGTELTSEEEFVDKYNYWIPSYLGAGLSVRSKKWLLAADYRVQYWNTVRNKNEEFWLTNSHHFAIGTQYAPSNYNSKNIFDKIVYQVGANYNRSYLKLNSQNIDSWGVSMGVIVPFRRQLSSLALSFEAGKKGLVTTGLFKENYYQLNLSISLNDFWFIKRKYQ